MDERNTPIVYAAEQVGDFARSVLARACAAIGLPVRLDVMPSGAIFRRLFAENGTRSADLLLTCGPYNLQASSADDTLQSFQPPVPPANVDSRLAASGPSWRWLSVGYIPFRLLGEPALTAFDALIPRIVPRLALPDPARTEAGMHLLVASLDRARQVEGDPERAWARWAAWQPGTLLPRESSELARAEVARGQATHALTADLAPGNASLGQPLPGLAPLPITAAILTHAAVPPEAQQLLTWLAGPDGADAVEAAGALSAWHAAQNGLAALARAAPPLDVAWAVSQYRPARQRWTSLGLTLAG